MKNPKARTSKKSAQASRTMTRQSAMNDINRGPDSLNLSSSELRADEIADLKRKFSDGEVFELPDSDLPAPTALQGVENGLLPESEHCTPNISAVDELTTTANMHSVSENKSQDSEVNKTENNKEDNTENSEQQSTKEKPQTRLPLPPKPFTIISGFRK